jgi:hypothetical protein
MCFAPKDKATNHKEKDCKVLSKTMMCSIVAARTDLNSFVASWGADNDGLFCFFPNLISVAVLAWSGTDQGKFYFGRIVKSIFK